MHQVQCKSILSKENGMNIYRGCTHGCIYCDSRSTCYQMNHDFEDIEVKINAPQKLEKKLRSKRQPCMIGTGAMSDPYMHCEEKLQLTRRCLELIDEYEFGVAVQTKSDLILRDLDLLKSINRKTKCVVQMTMTTFDEELCRIIEPNVCSTKRRAEVLRIMRDEGIPTIVWMSPFLPFINDTMENVAGLMNYCEEAKVHGVLSFGIGMTLRDGDREYFYKKLDEHFPGMKEKYIRNFGNAYNIPSANHNQLQRYIQKHCKENGMLFGMKNIFAYLHEFEDKQSGEQLSLNGFSI